MQLQKALLSSERGIQLFSKKNELFEEDNKNLETMFVELEKEIPNSNENQTHLKPEQLEWKEHIDSRYGIVALKKYVNCFLYLYMHRGILISADLPYGVLKGNKTRFVEHEILGNK
jgi:hypothetical protein